MATPVAQLRYYHGPERIRYLGRWALTRLLTIIAATIGVGLTLLAGYRVGGHACRRVWADVLLWINGIGVEVTGGDDLDPGVTYLFVVERQSALDTAVVLAALPVPFRTPASASWFRLALLGWSMRRVGYWPAPVDADDVAAELARSRERRDGLSILILIHDTGPDVATVSRLACEPIVPVTVINSGGLLPAGRRAAEPGLVEVRIGTEVVA